MPRSGIQHRAPRASNIVMNERTLLAGLWLMALALCAQPPTPAGLDPRFAWEAQTPWGVERSAEIAEALKLMALPVDKAAVRVEPFRILDNLYYVGIKPSSSFLITTSAGLVLIDGTLPDTGDLVLENVRKVGFDPAEIKYVLISHSHSDHFGGAGFIKERTGARIVSSLDDWKSIGQQQDAARRGGRSVGLPFARDIVKGEGESLTVGDNTFKFYVTPGHTVGALSVEFTAVDRGKSYRALGPGGLGMQFGPEWTNAFTQSMNHLKSLGPWDVIVTDHPFMMLKSPDELRRQLLLRGEAANPAVSGPARIDSWFSAILKVAAAKSASEQKTPKD
jgi:metallo-beta-lactamase class B